MASKIIKLVSRGGFQIKCGHHRAFGPASGNLVLYWILEAAGRSRSTRIWDSPYASQIQHVNGGAPYDIISTSLIISLDFSHLHRLNFI